MYDEFWTALKSLKRCCQCASAPKEVKRNLQFHGAMLSININILMLCAFHPFPNTANHQYIKALVPVDEG